MKLKQLETCLPAGRSEIRNLKTIFILLGFLLTSCAANKNGNPACYKKKKTILTAYYSGKLSDHYIKLRKGNYFDYYTRILGLTKIESHRGNYKRSGDSIFLSFCSDTLPDNLTGRGIINIEKNEVTLFRTNGSSNENFGIRLIGEARRKQRTSFNVLAFYTAQQDQAHITFVHEANRFFLEAAKQNNFHYDTSSNWGDMNSGFLYKYDVVLFLDTRPDSPWHRREFRSFVESGGGWIGFHFAAFALSPSDYPQNWDWYHNTFLGSGQYVSNTWKPTSATLEVENPSHPIAKGIPQTFRSSANEWYRWEKDLRENKDIEILASIHSSSFPLGTGPKAHEIWHSGNYPVVWTNKNYRMVYFNMGHNDIDYEGGTNKQLSFTFDNEVQNKFVLNALLWLGRKK